MRTLEWFDANEYAWREPAPREPSPRERPAGSAVA